MSSAVASTRTIPYLGTSMQLEWWEQGVGNPPILVLHGGNGFVPAPFTEALSESRRVIATQHPGFGDSDRPEWLDTVSDLAHFYLELLETQDLRDVTLLGFSSGGWIAAEMAVWRPDRIGRLILVDSVGIRIGGPTDRDIFDIFSVTREGRAERGFVDPVKAGLNVNELSDRDLDRLVRAEETAALYYWEPYMHNPKLRRRLAAIRVPSAVIWGDSDRVVTPEYGRALSASLPTSEFSVVEAAGHCPHIEEPEAFCRLVESFITRTTAS
jgi:pimeloyl-ACP methyl ester carboxylesterase